jgi:hypothetical protein
MNIFREPLGCEIAGSLGVELGAHPSTGLGRSDFGGLRSGFSLVGFR